MTAVLVALGAIETIAFFLYWNRHRPRDRYEVRIELTGGSVSLVEIRDWVVPVGRVHLITNTIQGPCPPPSIRHWVAAAMDRGENSGEMTLNRISSKWQVTRINGRTVSTLSSPHS